MWCANTIACSILCPIIISTTIVPFPRNLKIILRILYTNTTILSQQLRQAQWHLSNSPNVRAPPVPGASPPTRPLSPSHPPPFSQWSWRVLKFDGTWFARTQRICCTNNTGRELEFRCQTDGCFSRSSLQHEWNFSTWTCWAWIAWIIHFHWNKVTLNLT